MYAATGEPNVKWGAPMSNGGTGHHCPPLATALPRGPEMREARSNCYMCYYC